MIIFEQMLQLLTKGESFALAIILSRSGSAPRAAGTRMVVRADGTVVGIEEKPVLQKTVNAGVYVLSPAAVESVPAQTFYPITGLFEDALRQRLPCGAYLIEEEWLDVGHPSQLHRANGLL